MTKEEVLDLCAMAARRTEEGELSEDALEDVSGGFGALFWTGVGIGFAVVTLAGVYRGYKDN